MAITLYKVDGRRRIRLDELVPDTYYQADFRDNGEVVLIPTQVVTTTPARRAVDGDAEQATLVDLPTGVGSDWSDSDPPFDPDGQ